jgi:hypothetical protein
LKPVLIWSKRTCLGLFSAASAPETVTKSIAAAQTIATTIDGILVESDSIAQSADSSVTTTPSPILNPGIYSMALVALACFSATPFLPTWQLSCQPWKPFTQLFVSTAIFHSWRKPSGNQSALVRRRPETGTEAITISRDRLIANDSHRPAVRS